MIFFEFFRNEICSIGLAITYWRPACCAGCSKWNMCQHVRQCWAAQMKDTVLIHLDYIDLIIAIKQHGNTAISRYCHAVNSYSTISSCYGTLSQLPAMGMSPGLPNPNMMSQSRSCWNSADRRYRCDRSQLYRSHHCSNLWWLVGLLASPNCRSILRNRDNFFFVIL